MQATRSLPAALLAAAALAVALLAAPASAWQMGRATFYGNEPWNWNIHHGSCGFGYIWPDKSTGWDIAALADSFPRYGGSCGRCYEVKCDSRWMHDGYGESLDRSHVCKEGSVVLRTTDTCPCNYAGNYYSNKRWCCGDMDHMDISVWAFEKLADKKWGAIPIQYREVDCGYQPAKKATGGSFPGIFPPDSVAKQRPDFDWYKYFPHGGYSNPSNGNSRVISTDEFLRRLNQDGGGGGGGNGGGGASSASSSAGSASGASSASSAGRASGASSASSSGYGLFGDWAQYGKK